MPNSAYPFTHVFWLILLIAHVIFSGGDLSYFLYYYTYILRMTFSALLLYTNNIDALPKEGIKSFIGILFIIWPSVLVVSLQLDKNSLIGLKSGE